MSIRESLLPTLNGLRGLAPSFGLRRYTLTIRQRRWLVAVGTGAFVDTDTVLAPVPKVLVGRDAEKVLRRVFGSAGSFQAGEFVVTGITPAYYDTTDPSTQIGGYTPAQLVPTPEDDLTEMLYLLAGDEGNVICRLVGHSFAKAFRYVLVLEPTRRTP